MMKTLIVPIDFSKDASNAAIYALHLAKSLHSHITLCHSFIVPAETPVMAQEVWPLYDYESIKNDTTKSLSILSKKLVLTERSISLEQDFHPQIAFKSHNCALKDLLSSLVKKHSSDFVVMGLHGGGPLTRLFMGGRSRDIIADANYPVLLVPGGLVYRGIKKIAFATSLDKCDIDTIQSLASFAKCFDAEILLVHISGKDDKVGQEKVALFLSEVTNNIAYAKIYYRHLNHGNIDSGLDELSEDDTIDMLAMVHAKHNWFQQLINASHTRKIAAHINKPLLVFPKDVYPVF